MCRLRLCARSCGAALSCRMSDERAREAYERSRHMRLCHRSAVRLSSRHVSKFVAALRGECGTFILRGAFHRLSCRARYVLASHVAVGRYRSRYFCALCGSGFSCRQTEKRRKLSTVPQKIAKKIAVKTCRLVAFFLKIW